MRRLLLAALAFAIGCADQSCPTSVEPGIRRLPPKIGVCTTYGYGQCSSNCFCDQLGPPRGAIEQDWAECPGACGLLPEDMCLATSACRAEYFEPPPSIRPTFRACVPTAVSGPIQGGDCTLLDADGCARHDDCVAVYTASKLTGWMFDRCEREHPHT